LDTEEFVTNALRIHKNKYAYSKAIYHKYSEKVIITCPIHGDFNQRVSDHLRGKGCKKCASPLHNDTPGFIVKAVGVHGSKYGYEETIYSGSSQKIKIKCPIHGIFEQKARHHLQGKGCRGCAIRAAEGRIDSLSDFIFKASKKHSSFYTYDKVEYSGSKKEVLITCPEHGDFLQKPNSHLQGGGCPTCAVIRTSNSRRSTLEDFIVRAKITHGNTYDYSRVAYVNANTKIEIGCPAHGYFWQSAAHHLTHGCQKCSGLKLKALLTDTKEQFIEKARFKHSDFYDYSSVVYVKSDVKIEILCPTHGAFYQAPYSHLNGQGCPRCANVGPSKNEIELSTLLATFAPVVTSDREVLYPQEIDCYLPDRKIGVEFCGLFYHSIKFRDKNYHLSKLLSAQSKGVHLIQVFEDEWIAKPKIVGAILKNKILPSGTRIFARNTEVKIISKADANIFLKNNHLQGCTPAEINIGLFYEEKLVMVATFSSSRKILGTMPDNWFELVRLCTLLDTKVLGGFSKLLTFFIRNYRPSGVKTYCDRRYFDGSGYLSVGFKKSHDSPPSYYYSKGQKRFSRYSFQKHKLAKKLKFYDPLLTEEKNMAKNGYFRIYDCGTSVFTLEITP